MSHGMQWSSANFMGSVMLPLRHTVQLFTFKSRKPARATPSLEPLRQEWLH